MRSGIAASSSMEWMAWHPLITGKPLPKEFMVPANSISELLVPEEELEDHIIEDYDDE